MLGTEGQPTRIAVFEGSARFVGGGVDKTIKAGDTLVLSGNGPNLAAAVEKAAPDEFANGAARATTTQRKLGRRPIASRRG